MSILFYESLKFSNDINLDVINKYRIIDIYYDGIIVWIYDYISVING